MRGKRRETSKTSSHESSASSHPSDGWKILQLCPPLPPARYVGFHAMDDKAKSEPDPAGSGHLYGTIHIKYVKNAQTILAYEMNGKPLPVVHGAPLPLRVETQLGFTMVKYIRAIEFVEDYFHVGMGRGAGAEDHQYYSPGAGI